MNILANVYIGNSDKAGCFVDTAAGKINLAEFISRVLESDGKIIPLGSAFKSDLFGSGMAVMIYAAVPAGSPAEQYFFAGHEKKEESDIKCD